MHSILTKFAPRLHNFGMHQTLKNAIRQGGGTQRAVASALGIREYRLSKILAGRLRARGWERRELARLLRVPVSKLFPRRRRRVEG